jgi:DNA-binding beta-propeller fold protein YncE
MRAIRFGTCLAGLVAYVAATPAADTQTAAVHYSVIEQIAGPGTDWDYLSVDPAARRLYIAHNGVAALDLETNKLTTRLVAGTSTHGVLPLGNGMVAVDDSGNSVLTFFEGATGKVGATVHIPKSATTAQGFRDPDALALDPHTGLLVVVNADSGELVLVDQKKPAIVGTIKVGGNLEFLAADGAGTMFVNVTSTNEIVAVDIANRKVTRHFPMRECEEPTGLSFDERDHLLISVCANGVAKFIDARSGHDLKTVTIGQGADAVMFDGARRLVFVPSGEAGTLSIIAVRSLDDISLVETVRTQVGARTGALDPQTGRVYLPAAQFKPPTASFPFPRAIEGTFVVLVLAPK